MLVGGVSFGCTFYALTRALKFFALSTTRHQQENEPVLSPSCNQTTAAVLFVGWFTWALSVTAATTDSWFIGSDLKAGKADVLEYCSDVSGSGSVKLCALCKCSREQAGGRAGPRSSRGLVSKGTQHRQSLGKFFHTFWFSCEVGIKTEVMWGWSTLSSTRPEILLLRGRHATCGVLPFVERDLQAPVGLKRFVPPPFYQTHAVLLSELATTIPC